MVLSALALFAVSLGYGVVVPLVPTLAGGTEGLGLSLVYALYSAAKISAHCSTVVTPTIVEATKSCCFDHAVAKVTGDIPASLAISKIRAVDSSARGPAKRRAITA